MLKIILHLLRSVFRSRENLALENPLCVTNSMSCNALDPSEETRPPPLGRALPNLDGLAQVAHHRSSRDGPPLAPPGVPSLLEVEEPPSARAPREYLSYYSDARTHLGLGKDCPEARAIEPPGAGRVVALPRVGGLHHCYTRRAA